MRYHHHVIVAIIVVSLHWQCGPLGERLRPLRLEHRGSTGPKWIRAEMLRPGIMPPWSNSASGRGAGCANAGALGFKAEEIASIVGECRPEKSVPGSVRPGSKKRQYFGRAQAGKIRRQPGRVQSGQNGSSLDASHQEEADDDDDDVDDDDDGIGCDDGDNDGGTEQPPGSTHPEARDRGGFVGWRVRRFARYPARTQVVGCRTCGRAVSCF